MLVKDLVEKLGEYLPNLQVAIEDKHKNVLVLRQDLAFRMQKFQDGSSEKPYYKLVIYVPNDGDATAKDLFDDLNNDE